MKFLILTLFNKSVGDVLVFQFYLCSFCIFVIS